MPALTGTNTTIRLGDGVSITAPGLHGSADRRTSPQSIGGRGPVPEIVRPEFQALLHAAGFTEHRGIDVSVDTQRSLTPGGRAPSDPTTIEVPAPPAGQAAVLMIADDPDSDGRGVITWHFPDRLPTETRAATLSFRVPPQRLTAPSGEGAAGDRGLGQWAVKKLLSVLVYPIAEKVVGLVAEKVAEAWESHAHPYGVVQLAVPVGDPLQWVPMSDASWRSLSGKRVLLLVHGIFSTVAGGFGSLDRRAYEQLASRYFAVIGFNHPTVYADPVANVGKFLELVPQGVRLDLDVLVHSRGGLVARILSGELPDVPVPDVTVRRILFTGTPNCGTVLVDPSNLEHLVNRFTSLLNVLPDGPVTTVMSSVFEIVKIIGMGIEGGLPGLAAMQTSSELIKRLNASPEVPVEHYAVSTNFKPSGSLVALLKDGAMDLVFEGDANDVAVPTVGVGTVPGDPGFPVPDARSFTFPPGNVWHCSYFGQPDTGQRVLDWLTG